MNYRVKKAIITNTLAAMDLIQLFVGFSGHLTDTNNLLANKEAYAKDFERAAILLRQAVRRYDEMLDVSQIKGVRDDITVENVCNAHHAIKACERVIAALKTGDKQGLAALQGDMEFLGWLGEAIRQLAINVGLDCIGVMWANGDVWEAPKC